jgi:hypothetical protein
LHGYAPYCAEEAVAYALDTTVEFIGFEKDADIVNYGLLKNKEICKNFLEGTIQYNYCKTGEHPAKPLYEEVKYLLDNKCR